MKILRPGPEVPWWKRTVVTCEVCKTEYQPEHMHEIRLAKITTIFGTEHGFWTVCPRCGVGNSSVNPFSPQRMVKSAIIGS